jgi:hypothetical protein
MRDGVRKKSPSSSMVFGAVVAFAVAFVVALTGTQRYLGSQSQAASPTLTTAASASPLGEAAPSALADLTERWQRSQSGSFILEGTFTRSRAGTELVRQTIRIVRRGADVIDTRDGTTSARLAGQQWLCPIAMQCHAVGAADNADQELTRLGELVSGADPAYELVMTPDCAEFVRRRNQLVPALGDRTRYCFDPTSGALVRRLTERDGSIDLESVAVVSMIVTDQDLVLPNS